MAIDAGSGGGKCFITDTEGNPVVSVLGRREEKLETSTYFMTDIFPSRFPIFNWVMPLNWLTYPFSICTVSPTEIPSICSFHKIIFIVPVSSDIFAKDARWT